MTVHPDDGRRYALTYPRGVDAFMDRLRPYADYHAVTVYGTADLADLLSRATQLGIGVTWRHLDATEESTLMTTGEPPDQGTHTLIVTHELQVCTVCLHLIANGEYDDGTDAAQRCGQGMVDRWGELAGQIVPGLAEPCDCPPDADCDCEHLGYHTSPCDGCGDSDHGDRFAAVLLEPGGGAT